MSEEENFEKGIVMAIDFDGTCVTHAYPEIGKDIGAVPVLKALVDNGHMLVLWTMRDKEQLEDAVVWFEQNDIPLYGVQKNPTQHSWTKSPKAYAHIYLDHASFMAPVKVDESVSERPFYDWPKVEGVLRASGLLK